MLTFGGVLGCVGGFVILVTGLVNIAVVILAYDTAAPGNFIALGVAAGVSGIVLGLIMMIASVTMAFSFDSGAGLGVLIVVLSVVSLLIFWGVNDIGPLLGIIGGAVGVAFGSETLAPRWLNSTHGRGPSAPTVDSESTPKPAPIPDESGRTFKACESCLTVVPVRATSCPRCGKPLP
ncbi:MAG: hypothetical protein WBF81_05095 [Thermoplasmata archaeon]